MGNKLHYLDLRRWVVQAEPGDCIVYHTGCLAIDRADLDHMAAQTVTEAANEAYRLATLDVPSPGTNSRDPKRLVRNAVHLLQAKRGSLMYDYMMMKT